MTNVVVVKSDTLSKGYNVRFVVADKDSGEILDDAQGYGYKTARKHVSRHTKKQATKVVCFLTFFKPFLQSAPRTPAR